MNVAPRSCGSRCSAVQLDAARSRSPAGYRRLNRFRDERGLRGVNGGVKTTGAEDGRLDPVELLLHDDFLRALARSLVADESRARDVVQQTYVAALTAPDGGPRESGSLKAWLGAIVRNIAWKLRRSERRRTHRIRVALDSRDSHRRVCRSRRGNLCSFQGRPGSGSWTTRPKSNNSPTSDARVIVRNE